MHTNNEHEPVSDFNFEIDMGEYIKFVLKKWWIVAVSMLVCLAISAVYTVYFIAPQYTSQAVLYVINLENPSGVSNSDLIGYASLTQDYSKIIKNNSILRSVIEKGSLDTTPEKLSSKIKISTSTQSRLLGVSVTDTNPAQAKEICDLFCAEVKLQIKEMMNEDQITIIENGSLPSSPSSPNLNKNIILSLIAGFAVSVSAILIVKIFDDTIITREDVEKRLGLNVIGEIPYSSKLDGKGRRTAKMKLFAK